LPGDTQTSELLENFISCPKFDKDQPLRIASFGDYSIQNAVKINQGLE